MPKNPVVQWLLVLVAVALAVSVGGRRYLDAKVSQQAPPQVQLNSRHSGAPPLSELEFPPKGWDVFSTKGYGTLCGLSLEGQRGAHFDLQFADPSEGTVLEVAAIDDKPQPNWDGSVQLSGRPLFRIEGGNLWVREDSLGQVAAPKTSIRLTVTEHEVVYVDLKGTAMSFPLDPPLDRKSVV